jgi:hypothetical protein
VHGEKRLSAYQYMGVSFVVFLNQFDCLWSLELASQHNAINKKAEIARSQTLRAVGDDRGVKSLFLSHSRFLLQ